MSWGKIDDKLALHPKTMRAGNEAMGLWVRALSWSVAHLTDGQVPLSLVRMLDGSDELAQRLVDAGLWRETFDGFEFHDWAEYQFTRERVEQTREQTRTRLADWRAKKRGSNDGSNAVTNAVRTPLEHLPHTHTHTHRESATSEPVKSSKPKSSERSRGSRISDDFAVDDSLREYAKTKAPALDVDREREKFVNYWASASGANAVKRDWRRAFQNWLVQGQERAEQRGWAPAKVEARPTRSRLDAWLDERGISRDEYERRKGETGWLESLKGDS